MSAPYRPLHEADEHAVDWETVFFDERRRSQRLRWWVIALVWVSFALAGLGVNETWVLSAENAELRARCSEVAP